MSGDGAAAALKADEEAQAQAQQAAPPALDDTPQPRHERRCGFEPAALGWWYGWVVLVLCTLARLLKSYGQNNTLFVSVPGLLADNGMTRTTLGGWFSGACLVAAAAQPYFGRLHDRFGGQKCIPIALLALALALLGLAASHRPAGVFISLIGLRAVGLGALDTFTSNTVTRWFVRRRGMALAAMTIGFYLLTDLLTLQLVAAVTRAASWRAALRAAAATCVAAAPLCAALLRSTPEEVGLLPDGKATVAPSADGAADGVTAPPPPAPPPAGPELTRREALRVPCFWVWGAFTLVYFFGASGTDFHLKEMAREVGDVDVASSLSIATGISSALCCAVVGVMMDRGASGPRILAASGILLALYILLLTAVSSSAVAWLAGLVKGGADACASIALPFLHAQRFGRRHSGAIFAANRTLGVVGSGLGPLLLGVARDRGGAFAPALRACALLPLLCAAACLAPAAVLPPPLVAAPPAGGTRGTELMCLLAAEDAPQTQ